MTSSTPNLPEAFVIAAMTADGFIARDDQHTSTRWTSKEDTSFYVSKIKEAGAMVVGRKTFETISRFPKGMDVAVYTSKPEVFDNPHDSIQAFATADAPREVLAEMGRRGHSQVAISGGSSVYTQFMLAGVVSRMYITVEPVVFGQGVTLFNESLPDSLQVALAERHDLSPQTTVFEFAVHAA